MEEKKSAEMETGLNLNPIRPKTESEQLAETKIARFKPKPGSVFPAKKKSVMKMVVYSIAEEFSGFFCSSSSAAGESSCFKQGRKSNQIYPNPNKP